ncbi:MAG: cobalamin-dependent protein, partial [Elusimicrobiota bacterium]|nr:cobalamin-dependent protein [Elusimicrobiota bacterium]
MKLLIVVPRSVAGDFVNYQYLFPLGLAYISSVLKNAGHNVDCLNLNHYSGSVENLTDNFLSKKKYDYALTGGLSTSYNQIKMVADAVHKSASDVKLILGGGLISSEPELMLETLKPDYIVIGEGEKTVCELLKCLENKENVKDTAGIGYRDNYGKFICTKPQTPIDNL